MALHDSKRQRIEVQVWGCSRGLFVVIAILLIPAAIISKNKTDDVFEAMSKVDFFSISDCFTTSGPKTAIQDYLVAISNLVGIQELWATMAIIAWSLFGVAVFFLSCGAMMKKL